MIYLVCIKDNVKKDLLKLKKKNLKQFLIIRKKLSEISQDPHRYKNLKAPLNHLKRVHIDRHFVLLFGINEEEKSILLIDYGHHDEIYR